MNKTSSDSEYDGFWDNDIIKPYNDIIKPYKGQPKLKISGEGCTKGQIVARVLVVGLIICVIGSLIGAYYGAPHSSYHTFIDGAISQIKDHVITPIKDNQLSVGQALLYISLPIVGTSLLIGIAVHLNKKYQEFKTNHLMNLSITNVNEKRIFLSELKPKSKQVIIGVIALACIAGLAVGGYFLFKDLQVANQWMNNTVAPAFNQKIQLWQGLAYMGGSAVGAALLTGLVVHLLIRRAQEQERRQTIQNSMIF